MVKANRHSWQVGSWVVIVILLVAGAFFAVSTASVLRATSAAKREMEAVPLGTQVQEYGWKRHGFSYLLSDSTENVYIKQVGDSRLYMISSAGEIRTAGVLYDNVLVDCRPADNCRSDGETLRDALMQR